MLMVVENSWKEVDLAQQPRPVFSELLTFETLIQQPLHLHHQLQLQSQSYTLQQTVLRGIMQCYRLVEVVGTDVFARETNKSPRPAERSDRRDEFETGQMTCLRYSSQDQYLGHSHHDCTDMSIWDVMMRKLETRQLGNCRVFCTNMWCLATNGCILLRYHCLV